jgi:hypothetical protein
MWQLSGRRKSEVWKWHILCHPTACFNKLWQGSSLLKRAIRFSDHFLQEARLALVSSIKVSLRGSGEPSAISSWKTVSAKARIVPCRSINLPIRLYDCVGCDGWPDNETILLPTEPCSVIPGCGEVTPQLSNGGRRSFRQMVLLKLPLEHIFQCKPDSLIGLKWYYRTIV